MKKVNFSQIESGKSGPGKCLPDTVLQARNRISRKQAGAEMGQAQPKLGLELGLLNLIFVALN